ncbi:MAG: ABC transporter permease [Pseudonocardiaceae bacterium]
MSVERIESIALRIPTMGLPRAVRHALTLTRRTLRQLVRTPQLIVFTAIQPVIFVLLFNYVFGGAISPGGGYLNFLIPGIVVMFVAAAVTGTGIGLNTDMAQGVIDRFRSLPIARSAVLTGRIVAETVRIAFHILLVAGVGVLIGFRVSAGLVPVLGAFLLALSFGVALAWVGAWIGLAVRNPEAVQAAGFLWMFPLMFASSVFVPTETMPGWLRVFTDHSPISVVVNTLRALLSGAPAVTLVFQSLAWISGIGMVFSVLAVRRYRRIE